VFFSLSQKYSLGVLLLVCSSKLYTVEYKKKNQHVVRCDCGLCMSMPVSNQKQSLSADESVLFAVVCLFDFCEFEHFIFCDSIEMKIETTVSAHESFIEWVIKLTIDKRLYKIQRSTRQLIIS
jgi:hypothetical protein